MVDLVVLGEQRDPYPNQLPIRQEYTRINHYLLPDFPSLIYYYISCGSICEFSALGFDRSRGPAALSINLLLITW